jgi:seryl-tRNA synthetase
MLDPKFIRENLEKVEEAIRKKRVEVDLQRWLTLDEKRRELQQKLESKRAEQNEASKKIAQVEKEEKEEMIKAMSNVKKEVQEIDSKLDKVKGKWEELLMNVPNICSPNMPEGKSDKDNMEIKKWGEIREFDFDIKDHVQLGTALNIIDIETAAEVSGSRFFYLKNGAVLLQMAIVNLVFDILGNEEVIKSIIDQEGLDLKSIPFQPILPPVMIRNEVQTKIHRVFGDQTYKIQNEDLNLVASAEHTLAPYYMNKTLKEEELPKRFIGYSTAFRQEAGTYGKDMGGILRTHQFDKLEMESFTTDESGIEEQKLIVALQEYLVQQLKIPYRLVHVCTGDTGKPDYDQYDIECWMPAQDKYRETHTSDYMTDYQTRGIKSYYKTKDGQRKLLHTNDATAFAIGRILIAILENNQQEDGSVLIPDVLQKYMGGKKMIGVQKDI